MHSTVQFKLVARTTCLPVALSVRVYIVRVECDLPEQQQLDEVFLRL